MQSVAAARPESGTIEWDMGDFYVKIGARILKTGIAVSCTMAICHQLKLEPAFFGAVSAVVNMQPSIFLTMKSARDQILLHVIGVATGLFFGYLAGGTPLIMGIATVVLIAIYIRLGLSNGIATGIVAAIFVMGSSQELFLPHALNRTGVIFAGLATAMAVNVLLWPPRYTSQLKDKLKESNEAAVQYFCRAVADYVELENDAPDSSEEEKKASSRIERADAQTIQPCISRGVKSWRRRRPEQGRWIEMARKFVDYNEILTAKADRIFELLPVRLERRHQAGDPPISEEFKSILQILGSSCDGIQRVNQKLRTVIVENKPTEPEEFREDYWERLAAAIEQWQSRLTNSYYVRGLIEAAVTADEIRWAARQGKQLLQEGLDSQQE